jgi:phthalate 4,5-dioxygenase
VAMRRTLMEGATQCAATGQPHPAAANAWLFSVRAVQAVLPGEQDVATADAFLAPARATPPTVTSAA